MLKTLPTPRSTAAPVPGYHGYWCIDTKRMVGSRSTSACAPVPWCTSQSTISTRAHPSACAWRPASTTLLRKQNPMARSAMGFCFLNNVVLAGRQAQALGCARVLIVDWDVHHGNGTQALVERDQTVRFVSMHQYPWYPGTGAAVERGVGNVFNIPRPGGLPRATYVRDFLGGVDAALEDWQPDMLLISAGFDSLAGDPLGEFTLEPDDIGTWIEALRERMEARPVIAVLEGGYRLDLLAAGVVALVRALS